MAQITLQVLPWASSPHFGTLAVSGFWLAFTANGDTDGGVCLRELNDGKDLTTVPVPSFNNVALAYFEDPGTSLFSDLLVITSVTVRLNLKGTHAQIDALVYHYHTGGPVAVPVSVGTLGAAYSILESAPMTVNPVTQTAWLRADLFNNGNVGLRASGGWGLFVTATGAETFGVDYAALIVDYTPLALYYNTATLVTQAFAVNPGAPWVRLPTETNLVLDTAIAALEAQPCPWFLPGYSIRLTDATLYATFVTNYGFGTPLILGLSPAAAAVFTGAPLLVDGTSASQSARPAVYVDPSQLTLLGQTLSPSVTGGTFAYSYGTPFGRSTCVTWQWQCDVQYNPPVEVLVPYVPPYPGPSFVPPGSYVPSGVLLNQLTCGYGSGSASVTDGSGPLSGGMSSTGGGFGPCGCPDG